MRALTDTVPWTRAHIKKHPPEKGTPETLAVTARVLALSEDFGVCFGESPRSLYRHAVKCLLVLLCVVCLAKMPLRAVARPRRALVMTRCVPSSLRHQSDVRCFKIF